MNRTEVCRCLHDMVDSLMEMPSDWFAEGLFPTLRVTFRNPDTDDGYTLVVGVEETSTD